MVSCFHAHLFHFKFSSKFWLRYFIEISNEEKTKFLGDLSRHEIKL